MGWWARHARVKNDEASTDILISVPSHFSDHTAHRSDLPLSLVIPVFNEEARLVGNGNELIQYIEGQPSGSKLLIVDDGSTDGTRQAAQGLVERSPCVTYLHRPHLGKGAAVQKGLEAAETPLSGYTDVDLSTPLHEVDRLFQLAASTECLVIGSREMPQTLIANHQARRREWLGRLFNLWVRAMIAPGIRDTQCGAKFARREVWEAILPRVAENGFAWDAAVVAHALRLDIPVLEVGIEWSHDPSTRVRVWRDGLSMAMAVPRIAARSRQPDLRENGVDKRRELRA